MKFLRIPISVILVPDTEGGIEETVNGIGLVRIDEIQDIIASDGEKCSICFKSGDSVGCLLSLDEMAILIGEG